MQAEKSRLDATRGNTDEVWDAYSDMESPFLRTVEALPPTPENIPIKYRALLLLYDGDPSEVLGLNQQTTDNRIARQIFLAMGRMV